jgi:glycosyltransferase involved in cell wall biosynthesis
MGDGMTTPRVSVIVPVRDRRAMLRDMLDALAAQTFRDFEVIVVDDGSTDGSADEARRDEAAGLAVRVVPNAGRGAYAGRRTGVAMSSAEYLAFTDSDCVPGERWLEAGVAALDKGADVVNGRTAPARDARPLERTMGSGEELLYPTCNVFYRRAAYDAAGGFDDGAADRFGFRPGTRELEMGFGEDTIIAWRVRRAGGVAVYAPDALVHHAVLPPDLRDAWRRARMLHAFPALFREVPELRGGPLVRHGVVANTPGRLPLYVALLALLARSPRLAAGAITWWVATHVKGLRGRAGSPASRLASLPALLALDAVASVSLLEGSIRHRTVVL